MNVMENQSKRHNQTSILSCKKFWFEFGHFMLLMQMFCHAFAMSITLNNFKNNMKNVLKHCPFA